MHGGSGSRPRGHANDEHLRARVHACQAIVDLSMFVLRCHRHHLRRRLFASAVYAVVKFRANARDAEREPPQVYGSTQIELAWTIVPVLIVVVLVRGDGPSDSRDPGRAKPSSSALEVTVIGHQFWWEYRYPKLGIVTANELHLPVSDPRRSPTRRS